MVHEGTQTEKKKKRMSRSSCRGQLPGGKRSALYSPVQYVHVLHCHSNPVPVEDSHVPNHEPLSCVLMSVSSGPHCTQLSQPTYNRVVIPVQ